MRQGLVGASREWTIGEPGPPDPGAHRPTPAVDRGRTFRMGGPLRCKRCGAPLLKPAEEDLALCVGCLWALLASASWPQGREEASHGAGLQP